MGERDGTEMRCGSGARTKLLVEVPKQGSSSIIVLPSGTSTYWTRVYASSRSSVYCSPGTRDNHNTLPCGRTSETNVGITTSIHQRLVS